jgi:hypothetical protein
MMVHLRLIKEWSIKSNWKKMTNIFGEKKFVLLMRWCSMHSRIKLFSFWELMGVLNIFWFWCSQCLLTKCTPSCQSYVFTSSSQCVNTRGLISKNGILLLPSWLWPGISHPIHLTKQEGKFEANNGEKNK